MMGPTVNGGARSEAEDGAFALIKAVSDPKAFQERLEALQKRQQEAKSAEEAARNAMAKLDWREGELRKATADLDERKTEWEAERKQRLAAVSEVEAESAARSDELRDRKADFEVRRKEIESALNQRSVALDAKESRLSALDERVRRETEEVKCVLADTMAANKQAQEMRALLERKTAKLADVLREIAE